MTMTLDGAILRVAGVISVGMFTIEEAPPLSDLNLNLLSSSDSLVFNDFWR